MNLSKYIKGDASVWVAVFLLALASLLTVYSASSNLAYLNGVGDTSRWLIKHFVHLTTGIIFMYLVHRVNYKYFAPIAALVFPFVVLLLLYTLFQGTQIASANASRWIRIPFIGVSFQTSSLAALVIIMYLARYLSKNDVSKYSFKETLVPLILPIVLVCGLILPANFSTAALIFILSSVVLFVGGYKFKYLLNLGGIAIAGFGLMILIFIAFPNISNRVDTWKARVESYMSGESEENYQVERAKMAIAMGGITGTGPGKSVLKNFLPQSSSDFIYAIIIEEWGLLGGMFIMGLYAFLFFRFVVIATKSTTTFGSILTMGIGSAIFIQALINMGVVVNLFPVTGQTLPLISAGGSSIWIFCVGLGMILSVSRSYKDNFNEEIKPEITSEKEDEVEEIQHVEEAVA